MDPNLFHLDMERLLEVLVALIILSFLMERALAVLFESRFFINKLQGKNLKEIIIDINRPDQIATLSFLMPNKDLKGRTYDEFLTSVDEIERLSGLNFLSKLPTRTQEEIESITAAAVW